MQLNEANRRKRPSVPIREADEEWKQRLYRKSY